MFAYLLTEIASCKMNGMREIDENNNSSNDVCCEIARGLVLSFGFVGCLFKGEKSWDKIFGYT